VLGIELYRNFITTYVSAEHRQDTIVSSFPPNKSIIGKQFVTGDSADTSS